MILKFVKKLFVKWEMTYSTPDQQKHFMAVERLRNKGLEYKTKTSSFGGGFGRGFGGGFGGGEGGNSIYHIYVPKSTVDEANRVIHHN